jgi:Stage II sporulation protein M
MRADDLVLVQGVRDTRGTLLEWNRDFGAILRPWLLGSLAVACALLVATWLMSLLATPDPTPVWSPTHKPQAVVFILIRNSFVLALHAMACVAGFIAGSSLPAEAARYSGVWRTVHDHAGRVAMVFVGCATAFSLTTQSWILGQTAADFASDLDISTLKLLVGVLPHAIPELVALFLPLAAWLIASRKGAWHELLAATVVTVTLAVPVLVISALIEVYLSPNIVAALAS